MYARVARWTECDPEAISRNVANINERVSSGPPEGVPATAFLFLTDKANGTVVAISFYETEEDMRTGDETLNSMDPPEPMGTRASVDLSEVAIDVKA